MTLYDDMQGLAQQLLMEFKQGVISYVKVTPGNGPAHNPGASTETVTVLQGAVARGVKAKYVMQNLAVASDMQVTHAVQVGVEPDMNGFYDIDGRRYKIIQLIPTPPAGKTVAYMAIIRKGG